MNHDAPYALTTGVGQLRIVQRRLAGDDAVLDAILDRIVINAIREMHQYADVWKEDEE